LLQRGTVVDATLISAPASTKNRSKARDGEMHQTRKGKQWTFGAKAHIGVDADSGLIHSNTCTAANEADVSRTDKSLHGKERYVVGDSGYTGAHKREGLRQRGLTWYIAAMEEGPLKVLTEQIEHLKARLRARVEHPFHILKKLLGYRKVRYRGLKKNQAQLQVLFALVNLIIAKRALLA
jgi:transposase, IS5 family